jgi:hypothetical protein
MAYRDASRITVTFPAFDDAGGVGASFTACMFEGPNWSGFERPSTETTCSSDTLNAWGNLVRTYGTGTIVEMGTIEIGVDWDIDNTNGGDVYSSFQSRDVGDFVVNLPANSGETTGPTITFPGIIQSFTPQGTVLGTENEARFSAMVTIKLCGDITFTAPV